MEAMAKLEALLADHRGGFEGPLDDLLDILMQIVMDLLSDCGFAGSNGADIKSELAANESRCCRLVRRGVRRELRARYGWRGFRQHDGEKMVDAIIGAAKEPDATAANIDTLMRLAG